MVFRIAYLSYKPKHNTKNKDIFSGWNYFHYNWFLVWLLWVQFPCGGNEDLFSFLVWWSSDNLWPTTVLIFHSILSCLLSLILIFSPFTRLTQCNLCAPNTNGLPTSGIFLILLSCHSPLDTGPKIHWYERESPPTPCF